MFGRIFAAKADPVRGGLDRAQTTANTAAYPADLDSRHFEDYQRLKTEVSAFLNDRKYAMLRGFVRKKVVLRLLEKLQENALGEDNVPAVVSGVWNELRDVCGEGVMAERSVLRSIVKDIIHEYEESLPGPARIIVEKYVRQFNDYDEKLVSIVVRDMWPEIKQKLGV